jgi:hypothetical protein
VVVQQAAAARALVGLWQLLVWQGVGAALAAAAVRVQQQQQQQQQQQLG